MIKLEELISDSSRMKKINSTLKDKILRRNKQIKELRHNIWELRKQNMMFSASLRKLHRKYWDKRYILRLHDRRPLNKRTIAAAIATIRRRRHNSSLAILD